MRWPTISNLNRRTLIMTDNNPRFANLPRKRPGLIRDAISLLLIIAMCVAFYVVTP